MQWLDINGHMHLQRNITLWKLIEIQQSKGKVLPRTGHKDPKLEQLYRPTLSLTSALD
jgi:hypothetical protein